MNVFIFNAIFSSISDVLFQSDFVIVRETHRFVAIHWVSVELNECNASTIQEYYVSTHDLYYV
jgi:hypothetical protein